MLEYRNNNGDLSRLQEKYKLHIAIEILKIFETCYMEVRSKIANLGN